MKWRNIRGPKERYTSKGARTRQCPLWIFLLSCGKSIQVFRARFFTDIMQTGKILQDLKRSKIIAKLKSGKPAVHPSIYRLIVLLSVIYKLVERLIFNTIIPELVRVMSLTRYIEVGFQRKLKNLSSAFIELSTAYNTVWRDDRDIKLMPETPSKSLETLRTRS